MLLPFESLHVTPLGSGSHSPFFMQLAELGPMITNPGGQLNLIVVPSTGIMSSQPTTFGTESLLTNSGCPHLAIQKLIDSVILCAYNSV